MGRRALAIDPIGLSPSVLLTPVLDLLAQNGVPVEREIQHVKLPLQLLDGRDTLVPTRSFAAFMARVGQSQGIDNIGLRIFEGWGCSAVYPTVLTAIATSPTLYSGLRAAITQAYMQSSRVRGWLATSDDGDTFFLCHRCGFAGKGLWHFEMAWWSLGVMVSAVRLFLGPQWAPAQMGVPPDGDPGRIASGLFPNTRFVPELRENISSWIAIPLRHLSAPAIRNTKVGSSLPGPVSAEKSKLDFVGSLKQAVQGYLRDGSPNIQLASELAGVSARTLQRWLAQHGYTYSKLVDEARFEIARQLLIGESGMRVTDIAFEVGYSDQAHFTDTRELGC